MNPVDMLQDARFTRRSFVAGSLGALAAALLAEELSPLTAFAEDSAPAGPMDPSRRDGVIDTICEMCVWRCGVRATVRDGRVVKLDGNPDHPHSLGKLCPRGQAGLLTAYDPDRLKYPLIRAGKRGSGLWRRATWDEAMDYVAEQMKRIAGDYGPQAMVFSSTHNPMQVQFENLLNAYGSPNYGTQRSLCFNAMITANQLTFGVDEPGRDYANARYIVYAGRNLAEAISNSETQELVDAIARGAKVVVLDPRFTKTAAKAHRWLPVRPGNDLAFFLALIHELLANGDYDRAFVARHTVGFEALKAEVEPYTVEWASAKTEIPAETIRAVAAELGAARPRAFVHPNWRTSNFINSFQTERAIAVLNALIGAWGAPGGVCEVSGESAVELGAPPQPPYPRVSALRLDGVPWKYPLVPLKLGIFQNIREAVITGQPYQAKGWFIYRQNPVLSLPDRGRTLEAFNKLELIVNVDISMNDTAWYSDVVLPEATYLERFDPLIVVGDRVFIRQPVIKPLFESRSGLMIFQDLGTRLGLKDFFQYKDELDYLGYQVKPLGVSVEELRQAGSVKVKLPPIDTYLFRTPSGKVELKSSLLAAANQDAVPTWQEPPRPTAVAFYLLTGKVAQHTQFATQNNRYLHELEPGNALWMNPGPAAARELADGETVVVKSRSGEVRVPLRVTEAIRSDCVYLTPGFGHVSKALMTAFDSGVSDSDLHETFTDPVSGGQALSQTFVTVEKV